MPLSTINTHSYQRKELSKAISSQHCAQIRQMHTVDETMTDVDTNWQSDTFNVEFTSQLCRTGKHQTIQEPQKNVQHNDISVTRHKISKSKFQLDLPTST